MLTVFFGLFFLLLALLWLKGYYHELRPCDSGIGEIPSKLPCPPQPDYSFPSGHVAITFFFASAAIGTGVFFPFYLLALFTAFSRIYLGVHYLVDVSGGMVLGIIIFAATEKIIDSVVGG